MFRSFEREMAAFSFTRHFVLCVRTFGGISVIVQYLFLLAPFYRCESASATQFNLGECRICFHRYLLQERGASEVCGVDWAGRA